MRRVTLFMMVVLAICLLSGFGLPDTPDPAEDAAEEVLPEPDYEIYGIVADASPDQWSGVAKGDLSIPVGSSDITYIRATAGPEHSGAWFELPDSIALAWDYNDELSITRSDSIPGALIVELLQPTNMVFVSIWPINSDSTVLTDPEGEEIEDVTITITEDE